MNNYFTILSRSTIRLRLRYTMTFIILLIGIAMIYGAVKKKSVPLGLVGALILLVSIAGMSPTFMPATQTLLSDIGSAFAKWGQNAF